MSAVSLTACRLLSAGVCSVSGAVLRQQDALSDPHVVELGHSTRLAVPPGAAVLPLRVAQSDSSKGNDAAAAAADAAPAGTIMLRCVRQVKVSSSCSGVGVAERSSGLVWGQLRAQSNSYIHAKPGTRKVYLNGATLMQVERAPDVGAAAPAGHSGPCFVPVSNNHN